MQEIWKYIPNYPNYQVSNLGNVKSLNFNKEKILKPFINNSGYYRVAISKNGKKKKYYVHQLVAMAFIEYEITTRKISIDHINGIKTDNNVDNLQIMDLRNNVIKSINKESTSSKYVGVSKHSQYNKWVSNIHIGDNKFYLGIFKTEKVASAIYQYELEKINRL